MNAYELYDAAFNSANDYQPTGPADIEQYADAVYLLPLADGVADRIWAAHVEFTTKGDGSNDFCHMVEGPLSEIELREESEESLREKSLHS